MHRFIKIATDFGPLGGGKGGSQCFLKSWRLSTVAKGRGPWHPMSRTANGGGVGMAGGGCVPRRAGMGLKK